MKSPKADTSNTMKNLNGPWRWQKDGNALLNADGRQIVYADFCDWVLLCVSPEVRTTIAKVPEMKAALRKISDLIIALVPDEQEKLVIEAKKINQLLAEMEG